VRLTARRVREMRTSEPKRQMKASEMTRTVMGQRTRQVIRYVRCRATNIKTREEMDDKRPDREYAGNEVQRDDKVCDNKRLTKGQRGKFVSATPKCTVCKSSEGIFALDGHTDDSCRFCQCAR
jgi:hypothetical protein